MPARRARSVLGLLLGIVLPPLLAGVSAVFGPALAEPPPTTAPGTARSVQLQPVAIYDKDGNIIGGAGNPIPMLGMPFKRAGDPFVLSAAATPAQYRVTQPAGADSYRAINPCQGADVRVKSVTPTVTPIATEATAYPGVARVTSATGTVTATTGTRFMGRYGETLASTPNPMPGSADRIISVMIVPVPGSTADISGMTCPFELQYGTGG